MSESIYPLFLPCPQGVQDLLADEVHRLTGLSGEDLLVGRAGVLLRGTWSHVLLLNLHSRLAQRVLLRLAQGGYRSENDLYELASSVAWEAWFGQQQTFKVDLTAQHSPLQSLNFAALKIKDAIADRFRNQHGARPSVDTQHPDVRVFVHLESEQASLYIDTSGEPLFKRGWRQDKGDAPLKETLAAAMIAASGWSADRPLYDPCCGSGTIAIEAAQIACQIAPGLARRFAFERLHLQRSSAHQALWQAHKESARASVRAPLTPIFGSDVAHRMVDFASRNAERAGVLHALQLRGGDALDRKPPSAETGLLLLNPPYGERIAAAGSAGVSARERVSPRTGRERFAAPSQDLATRIGSVAATTEIDEEGVVFFERLSSHWKKHYSGWQAWLLSPDMKLPSKMRLQASRRIPMWNGPIECRLFRFDLVTGSLRKPTTS